MTDQDPTSEGPEPADPGDEGAGGSGGTSNDDAGVGASRSRRVLTDIAPRSWEHPADKAALQALRRIPVFDRVLRGLFGFFGEKPIRLAFQANAVRVGPTQFPRVHAMYMDVLKTLDAPREYPLLVSQTPIVNAGAYGMKEPFIILNSGTLILLEDDELEFILGHEVGHILSDHVLYRTMTVLLIQLAGMGFPIVGLAARAVLVGLLEWYRKSELSADRAGLLSIQDPQVAMRTQMKMAGGEKSSEMNLDAFIEQAEEYRTAGDVADEVYKVVNMIWSTHPFWVPRLAALREWIEAGEYDRILRGEYARTDEPNPSYQEDLRAATEAYRSDAGDFAGNVGEAARKMAGSIFESFRPGGPSGG